VLGVVSAWADRSILAGTVRAAAGIATLAAWAGNLCDKFFLNRGFDGSCNALRRGGGLLSLVQAGRVQNYLRIVGVGVVVLLAFIGWLLT